MRLLFFRVQQFFLRPPLILGPTVPVLPLLAFVYVAPDAVVTCAPTGAASCALELLFAVFLNVFTMVGSKILLEAFDLVLDLFAGALAFDLFAGALAFDLIFDLFAGALAFDLVLDLFAGALAFAEPDENRLVILLNNPLIYK